LERVVNETPLPQDRRCGYNDELANIDFKCPGTSMNNKQDHAFIRQFSGVIAAFVVLTIVLIFVARGVEPEVEEDETSSRAVLAEQRIAPVGAVRSGESGAAALAEAATALTALPEPEDVVVDGPSVYNGLCAACHESGAAGAPIRGSADMAARADERGLDGLVQNAINGINAMPARGGNPALTDEQIRASVEYMLQ
jgi:cytochrome c5